MKKHKTKKKYNKSRNNLRGGTNSTGRANRATVSKRASRATMAWRRILAADEKARAADEAEGLGFSARSLAGSEERREDQWNRLMAQLRGDHEHGGSELTYQPWILANNAREYAMDGYHQPNLPYNDITLDHYLLIQAIKYEYWPLNIPGRPLKPARLIESFIRNE